MLKNIFLAFLFLFLLCFSQQGSATSTYLWWSDSDPFGGQLWDQPSNWWLQGGVPGEEDIPDSIGDVALLSEVVNSQYGHYLDLYGSGVLTIRGLEMFPVTQAYSITPGGSVSPGSFSFATASSPTPYINVTTTSHTWSDPNTISANISVTSDLVITVGPYTGTNKELLLSGAVTGGGDITKLGPSDLRFTGAVECNIDIGNGDVIFDGVASYASVLSGSGDFIKKGTGTLLITSAQTLTGPVMIEEGSITLSSSADLSTTQFILIDTDTSLIIDPSAGAIEISSPRGRGGIVLSSETLTINQSSPSDYYGVISGLGNLTKTGAGTLHLAGANTYSGTTTISAGGITLRPGGEISESSLVTVNGTLTLGASKSVKGLGGSGSVVLEGNTLTISEGGAADFSGVISDGGNENSGSVFKTGTQTATLSGSNTFTGSLTVSQGGLTLGGTTQYTGQTFIDTAGTMTIVNSGNISNSSSVLIKGTLIFNGSSSAQTIHNLSGSGNLTISNAGITVNESSANGALTGQVTGTGTLTKTGAMSLTLSGDSSAFLGSTSVNAGALVVTGTLGGDLTVNTNGTLQGTGTIGTGTNSVTNAGKVAPGTSIGTLTIDGSFEQQSGGNLEIEIAGDGSRDVLNVTGAATLTSKVTISPLPGLYKANTAYTFITAGSVSGFFNESVELRQVTGTFTYTSSSVIYTLSNSAPVLPVPIFSNVDEGLKGNALRIARYLFKVNDLPNNLDLEAVYLHLLGLNSVYFPIGLQRLGPTQFGALPLVSLQSDVRAADIFVENTRRFICCDSCKSAEVTNGKNNLWVQPIIYDYTQSVYDQEELQQQVKFNSLTYGAMLGTILQPADNWFLSPGIGYSHSNLKWEKRAGKAGWNTLYLAPSVGYAPNFFNTYLNMTLLGAINFYNVERHIFFTGVNRKAQNCHTSFDILARFDSGCLLKFNSFFIQPEGTFNCLTVIEPEYTENGADSLNLTVFRKTSLYFRPQVITRFGFRFGDNLNCFSPSVKIGWVSDIPITNGFYHARLRNETFQTGNVFPVLSFHRATAQLVVGGELSLKVGEFFILGEFGANYLDKSMVQMGRARLEWNF